MSSICIYNLNRRKVGKEQRNKWWLFYETDTKLLQEDWKLTKFIEVNAHILKYTRLFIYISNYPLFDCMLVFWSFNRKWSIEIKIGTERYLICNRLTSLTSVRMHCQYILVFIHCASSALLLSYTQTAKQTSRSYLDQMFVKCYSNCFIEIRIEEVL